VPGKDVLLRDQDVRVAIAVQVDEPEIRFVPVDVG
jgi:hypothetical protein